MQGGLLLNLWALVSLLPISAFALRRPSGRDALFWALLAIAAIGPVIVAADELAKGWLTSLSTALWLSIAASMVMFAGVCAATKQGWRLTPLLLPYLFLFGICAALAEHLPAPALPAATPMGWLDVHVLVSVATYGLLTIAAIAGLAVFIQERTLKRRRPGWLTSALPSVADAELLQIRLLAASCIVLGCGLLTGAATQYVTNGRLFEVNHKTVFAVLAFAVIVLLLLVHQRTGLRGRRAARYVLLAYLLLTLAYPGVKFVTDVLLA